MTAQIAPDVTEQGRSTGMWAGILGAAAIWAVQLQTLYALSPWLCRSGRYMVIHLLTVLFLVGAAMCGLISLRSWRAAGSGSPDTSAGGPIARTRFLGALGAATSLLFFLLILAQGMASFSSTHAGYESPPNDPSSLCGYRLRGDPSDRA